MFLILLVILLLLAVGGLPPLGPYTWQHGYGWTPSTILFVLIIVLIVIVLTRQV